MDFESSLACNSSCSLLCCFKDSSSKDEITELPDADDGLGGGG